MSTIATNDSSEAFIVQKLSEKWEELLARVKSHFCRPETRQSVGVFLRALFSRAERKNAWGLSEKAGKRNPYAFQHLLRKARWEADEVRDDVMLYARQQLGEGGGLVLGFLGDASVPR